MKFKKFCERVTPYGQIVKLDNCDEWLIGGCVGMKIPTGVVNILGGGAASEEVKTLVYDLTHADMDKRVYLTDAVLLEPDGKAADIIRCFGAAKITNKDYGLLEKGDTKLSVTVAVDDELNEHEYLLVLDCDNAVCGFIQCIEE